VWVFMVGEMFVGFARNMLKALLESFCWVVDLVPLWIHVKLNQ